MGSFGHYRFQLAAWDVGARKNYTPQDASKLRGTIQKDEARPIDTARSCQGTPFELSTDQIDKINHSSQAIDVVFRTSTTRLTCTSVSGEKNFASLPREFFRHGCCIVACSLSVGERTRLVWYCRRDISLKALKVRERTPITGLTHEEFEIQTTV